MTMLRAAGITIALFFASTSARADEISDEQAECTGKGAGAPCSGGTCQESECSAIDYSGGEPRSVKRSCMTCVADSANVAEPAKAEPAPAKAEPAPSTSRCAVESGPLSFGATALGILLIAIARRRSRPA